MLIIKNSLAQDSLFLKNGTRLHVKIIDTSGGKIVYQPLFQLQRFELDSIKFWNGNTEKIQIIDPKSESERLRKGNKVFIKCSDHGAFEHIVESIQSWNFWQYTNLLEEADLILEANIEITRKVEVKLRILSPIDLHQLITIPSVYVLVGDHFNPKRAAIQKAIGTKLRVMVE